jgi:hypothetical protein
VELGLIVTTAVSAVLAVGMGIFAWRLAREERRRSAARVAALASELRDAAGHRDRTVVGIRAEPARIRPVASRTFDVDSLELGKGRGATPDAELFRTGPANGSRSTLAMVVGVGGIAVATALALVIATGRGGGAAAEPTASPSLRSGKVADTAPLELIALSHSREGERLTVRGVVRNPSSAVAVDQLAAVVLVFDRDGGFLASERAALRVPELAPGAESTFVVSVGRAAGVGRYRVSFRSGDTVIPHVDRRGLNPAAQLR